MVSVISRLKEDKNLTEKSIIEPVLAASVLLLREQSGPLEVFMVERHAGTSFASALVFPGGKVSAGDHTPELRVGCAGAEGLSDVAFALRVAAIREVFEEAGILLAHAGASLISMERAAALVLERDRLASGALTLPDFVANHDLRLACDALVPFAHWITPEGMAKRFDTHFFIAAAPEGHAGVHDGGELVASEWITPRAALDRAQAGNAKLMFPTQMNLMRLAESRTISDALRAARGTPIIPVEPKFISRDGRKFITIPPDAGYALTELPLQGIEG